jgi:SAM-dependent methyltransferase
MAPVERPSMSACRRLDALRCPRCGGTLETLPSALVCSCGADYRVSNGVARFVADDDFYEGAYEAHVALRSDGSLRSELALYLVNTHYLWWVRKHVPAGGHLLELGCGGGVSLFAELWRATGLDLSFRSLRRASEHYELALQADALRMPLVNHSYDAVVSAYFYEHIDPASKELLLEEMKRVLRPGGRIVFLFDVLSSNPLYRYYRSDQQRFEECFVQHDHHYGLEPASVNLERFERHGFRVIDAHLANKTVLQHLPAYRWARPYGTPLTRMLSGAAEAIASRRPLNLAWQCGVTLFDDLVEPVFPTDWARIMLVALERS